MRNCGLTQRKGDLLTQVCEMGISSNSRDWFNLYWRRKINALKHLLTERLRSHKHLPPFHAMELLAFPNSSRYRTPTIACVEGMYHHRVASTASFGGSVQDTEVWHHPTRGAGKSAGVGLGKDSGSREEANGSWGQA